MKKVFYNLMLAVGIEEDSEQWKWLVSLLDSVIPQINTRSQIEDLTTIFNILESYASNTNKGGES